MKIACEKCGIVFNINASQVPSTGLQMKCTSCFHSFTVAPPTMDLPSSGELPDGGPDFVLSNSPEDFAAPSGYVDPTTKNITAYESADVPALEQVPSEITDLPGLPQQRPEITDLPGLPQQRSPEITDLPGLPQQRSPEITDLPGLPKQRAPA
ncbi:MAG: zinc-ribbon domain-containing protein, partial [Deltaproteobacteria bacterium]|nr:zinc-ribbon domain-containing protein [Deltaproteobacteria bacterium]